jgi:hypothetical protein
MSLRAALRTAVARFTPLAMQPATSSQSDATAVATGMQLTSFPTAVIDATGAATYLKQPAREDATAARLNVDLLAAAMRACDHHRDGGAAREQMRRDCLATPLHLRADLIDHFHTNYPKKN